MQTNEKKPKLSVDKLKKHYGEIKAVDDLSFNLYSGEIYGLLGPNGAGKTTTLKSILGLIEFDSGNIKILGMDPRNNNEEIKALIGYISEEPLVYKSLSPREMFDFIASVRKLNLEETTTIITDLLDSLVVTANYLKTIENSKILPVLKEV